MKAVEFKTTVRAGGHIAVPPEVASQIPPGEPLQVVILWEISNLDTAWRAAGRQRFEAAYAPEDSVYDQLLDDASAR